MSGPRTSPSASSTGVRVTFTYSGGSIANSTTVLADVTSAALVLSAGTWDISFAVTYNAAATTTGAHFTVNGTTPATYIKGLVNYTTLTTDSDGSLIFAYDSGLAVASSRVTVGNGAIVIAQLTIAAACTITLRFRSEVGASAITVTGVTGQAIKIA